MEMKKEEEVMKLIVKCGPFEGLQIHKSSGISVIGVNTKL